MVGERFVFVSLIILTVGLLHVIAFWRRKAGEAAYMQPHEAQAGKTKGNAIAVWR